MPGTLKLWWHDGATLDARAHPTPLINEPDLGFVAVAVGASPVSLGPAPEDCTLAAIETDVAIRYRVIPAGGSGDALEPAAKPMPRTGFAVATIGLSPGATLSVVEG